MRCRTSSPVVAAAPNSYSAAAMAVEKTLILIKPDAVRRRLAAEILGHVLVRRALQVEPERVGLERGQRRRETPDQRLQLLGRDDLHRWLVDVRGGERIAESDVAVRVLAGGRVAE